MIVRAARAEVRKTAQRPRLVQSYSMPAPTRGWIANGNLAAPEPGGAAVLENWFPTAQGAIMRRGIELYATMEDAADVVSLFSYKDGAQEELFSASAGNIYNITTVPAPEGYSLVTDADELLETDDGFTFGEESTEGLDVVTGLTGGDWVALQFASSGGIYLILVNGADDMLIYDGDEFYPIDDENLYSLNFDAQTGNFAVGLTITGGTSGATAVIKKIIDNGTTGTLYVGTVTSGPFQDGETITDSATGSATVDGVISTAFSAVTGVATANLSYVWAFKNRVFFIQKDTLDAWYLSVDAISGAATKFPLGGVFQRGGKLLFGASWSLDAGDGLSNLCIFVTTEGEVAVYAGTDPASWALSGVYRIGKPLGKRAFIRAGGDLVIATDVGFVPLSQAIQKDYAALSPSAVSYPIEDAWNDAVEDRSSTEWNCEVWPAAQMVVVALPTVSGTTAEMFVANARTGAWAKYTGWNATCLEIFRGRMFFGSLDGKIYEANVSGYDDGTPYTCNYVPLFSDLGVPGLKTATLVRNVIRSPYPVNDQVSVQVDFTVSLPSPPDAAIISGASAWGAGIWGTSVWGGASEKQTFQALHGVTGFGYAMSPSTQITSGAIVPIDGEIVRTDILFTPGETSV
jgi:hypothetical protein